MQHGPKIAQVLLPAKPTELQPSSSSTTTESHSAEN